jgi:DNA-binding CsgD family transcriptional regulator
MIIDANKNAKRFFSALNSELVGLHLADLVQSEEQGKVSALLRLHQNRTGLAGQIIHIRQKSNGTIPVLLAANMIDINDANVIVMTVTAAPEAAPARSIERTVSAPRSGLDKKLTHREREILSLICSGKTSRAIAQQLCISDKTVETHRARIMQKLDKHCVVDLVKYAIANNIDQLQ